MSARGGRSPSSRGLSSRVAASATSRRSGTSRPSATASRRTSGTGTTSGRPSTTAGGSRTRPTRRRTGTGCSGSGRRRCSTTGAACRRRAAGTSRCSTRTRTTRSSRHSCASRTGGTSTRRGGWSWRSCSKGGSGWSSRTGPCTASSTCPRPVVHPTVRTLLRDEESQDPHLWARPEVPDLAPHPSRPGRAPEVPSWVKDGKGRRPPRVREPSPAEGGRSTGVASEKDRDLELEGVREDSWDTPVTPGAWGGLHERAESQGLA